MITKITLYKLPIHSEDIDRYLPIDQTIDQVLANVTKVKEYTFDDKVATSKQEFLFTKEGTMGANLKLFEENYLDFNYVRVESPAIKYFGKTTNYFFVENWEKNLVHNTDKVEYFLTMDTVATYGKEFIRELKGKNVEIKRNHVDRWEHRKTIGNLKTFNKAYNTTISGTGNTIKQNTKKVTKKITLPIKELGYWTEERVKQYLTSKGYPLNLNIISISKNTSTKTQRMTGRINTTGGFVTKTENNITLRISNAQADIHGNFTARIYIGFPGGINIDGVGISALTTVKRTSGQVSASLTKSDFTPPHVSSNLVAYELDQIVGQIYGGGGPASETILSNINISYGQVYITPEVTFSYIGTDNGYDLFNINRNIDPIFSKEIKDAIDKLTTSSTWRNALTISPNIAAAIIFDYLKNELPKQPLFTDTFKDLWQLKTIGPTDSMDDWVRYNGPEKKIEVTWTLIPTLNDIVPAQDRHSPIWSNNEIKDTYMTANREIEHKSISHKWNPRVEYKTKDAFYACFPKTSKTDAEIYAISAYLQQNLLDELSSNNYYGYVSVPTAAFDVVSKDSTGNITAVDLQNKQVEKPHYYIPIQTSAAVTFKFRDKLSKLLDLLGTTIWGSKTQILSLYDKISTANKYENFFTSKSFSPNAITNIIVSDIPLYISAYTDKDTQNIETTLFQKISYKNRSDATKDFYGIQNPIKVIGGIKVVDIMNKLELPNKLPSKIDSADYDTKNIEITLLNSSYQKVAIKDLLQAEEIELDNFDVINGRTMTGNFRLNSSGTRHTLKLRNAQDYIDYDNTVNIPFAINSEAEFLQSNKNKLDARKSALDTQQSQSLMGTGISGGLGLLGGLLAGVGGAGIGKAFGAMNMFQAGGGVATGVTGANSTAQVQKEQINAELADQSRATVEPKPHIIDISNLQSPIEIDTNVFGVDGTDLTPQTLKTYKASEHNRRKLQHYFNRNGYSVDKTYTITDDLLRNRYLFNYLQLGDITQHLNDSNIPTPVLIELERKFMSGIRIWHCRKDIATKYKTLRPHSIKFDIPNYETEILKVKDIE